MNGYNYMDGKYNQTEYREYDDGAVEAFRAPRPYPSLIDDPSQASQSPHSGSETPSGPSPLVEGSGSHNGFVLTRVLTSLAVDNDYLGLASDLQDILYTYKEQLEQLDITL